MERNEAPLAEGSDGARSAHFEHTVALTDDGPEILTVAG